MTDVSKPLVQCFLRLEGYQEGSGNPSPSNIRPIVGFSSADLVLSPAGEQEVGTTYPYSWIPAVPYPVMDGYLDAVSGKVHVEKLLLEVPWSAFMDKESIGSHTRGQYYFPNTIDGDNLSFCNLAPRSWSYGGDYLHYFISSAGAVLIVPNELPGDTVVQIAYRLREPVEVDLVCEPIITLIGENCLSDSIEMPLSVVYLKKAGN